MMLAGINRVRYTWYIWFWMKMMKRLVLNCNRALLVDKSFHYCYSFDFSCRFRKFMSKNVDIRDLLEKADKALYKKRSNDPECPFFQFLPKEKNMRYNFRNTSVSVPRIHTERFKNVFRNRIIF